MGNSAGGALSGLTGANNAPTNQIRLVKAGFVQVKQQNEEWAKRYIMITNRDIRYFDKPDTDDSTQSDQASNEKSATTLIKAYKFTSIMCVQHTMSDSNATNEKQENNRFIVTVGVPGGIKLEHKFSNSNDMSEWYKAFFNTRKAVAEGQERFGESYQLNGQMGRLVTIPEHLYELIEENKTLEFLDYVENHIEKESTMEEIKIWTHPIKLKTLLSAAASFNNVQILQVLLSKFNFDINQIDDSKSTVFWNACSNNSLESIKLLLKYGRNTSNEKENNEKENNENKDNKGNEKDKVEDKGKDKDKRSTVDINKELSDKNITALFWAVKYNNIELLKLLKEHNYQFEKFINLKVQGMEITPWLFCIYQGNYDCFEYLLTQCIGNNYNDVIDIYSTYDQGENALHGVFRHSDIKFVQFLEEKFNFFTKDQEIVIKYINGQGRRGQTPMHYICTYGSVEIIKYFIQICVKYNYTIDMNLKDNLKGESVISTLATFSKCELVEYLIENEDYLVNKVKVLINYDINMKNDGKNGDSMTGLMMACVYNRYAFIKSICKHKNLDILIKCTRFGVSLLSTKMINSLDVAVKYGSMDAFKVLINILIERNSINSWDELINGGFINSSIIEEWIKITTGETHSKTRMDGIGLMQALLFKDDESKKDGKIENRGLMSHLLNRYQKKRAINERENSRMEYFLRELMKRCFDENKQNYQLFIAMMNTNNNDTIDNARKLEVNRRGDKLYEISCVCNILLNKYMFTADEKEGVTCFFVFYFFFLFFFSFLVFSFFGLFV